MWNMPPTDKCIDSLDWNLYYVKYVSILTRIKISFVHVILYVQNMVYTINGQRRDRNKEYIGICIEEF